MAATVFGMLADSGGLFTSELRAQGVQIKELPGKLRIEIDGKLFTEYNYTGAPHVYFYPVLGPAGLPMTRNAPMKEVEGESQDHRHHRSLWFSHGEANGVDFWSESPKAGQILHQRFGRIQSGEEAGWFSAEHNWVAPGGAVVCTDELVFRVQHTPEGERVFDFQITIRAGEKDLVLGDTKEGSMAIRIAETMRLAPNEYNKGKPTGQIVQSTGARDGSTWGKRAAWCDYHGPVQDKIVGVAMFDHPDNPRHPTWWHVRDYGLFAANPFGIHDFEKKPAGTGSLTIPAGQHQTWRYQFYLHEGDEKQAQVARRYEAFAKTPHVIPAK
jgi:hypothetical protein